jgi:hypothetical protein
VNGSEVENLGVELVILDLKVRTRRLGAESSGEGILAFFAPWVVL